MLKQLMLGAIAASFLLSSSIAPAHSAPNPAPSDPAKPSPAPADPSATPDPETQFTPRARVWLSSDRVTITLINRTYAKISYQAVGDTQPRTLEGRQSVTLRSLRVPVTLTFDRQDAGLLDITPKQSEASPEALEVTLDAATNLNADGTTMRVEKNGSVFLY
jgi:hypothetical protein